MSPPVYALINSVVSTTAGDILIQSDTLTLRLSPSPLSSLHYFLNVFTTMTVDRARGAYYEGLLIGLSIFNSSTVIGLVLIILVTDSPKCGVTII